MKPTTRDISVHISHVENALAAYLKPFFPEAIEIEGVDIQLPLSSHPGTVKLSVYLRQKSKGDIPQQAELNLEPANDNEEPEAPDTEQAS